MSPNRPPQKTVPGQKINQLLAADQPFRSPLQNLLRKANAQIGWTRDVRALLPPELARDCRVLDIRDGTLVIGCRSAASATRIRFEATTLMVDLRSLADFSGVRDVRVQLVSSV